MAKKCPKCGHEKFYVTAHVTQGWLVDNTGDFLEVIDDCEEVTHNPDDSDLWECAKCGYVDRGSVFNQKKSDEQLKTRLQDFKEKYPQAVFDADGAPEGICPWQLGYEDYEGECIIECIECWNKPAIKKEKPTLTFRLI